MRTRAVNTLKIIQKEFDRISTEIQPLWHPLGFVSCIVSDEGGVTTRLHYWPSSERRPKNPNWPIHTHLYNLSSLVVFGSLRDLQYHCFPGSDYVGYRVNYIGENSELIDLGKKYKIEIVRETVLRPHGFYSVEQGVFHESEVKLGQETLTLVQCSSHSRNPAIVLAPAASCIDRGAEQLEYIRQPFDGELFWKRARSFVDIFLRSEDNVST